MQPLEIDTFVFDRSRNLLMQGRLMMVGAVGLACFAVLGFAIALFGRVDQITLHLVSTMPLTMAVGLFWGGWSLCSGPRRVVIDNAGMEIEQGRETQKHLWSELGWATVATAGMTQQRVLVVYDRTGRKLASLSESFENFDELISAVKSRLADQPGEISTGIQSSKARRSALFIASVATVLLLACGGVAWMTFADQRVTKLLATAAIDGEAKIDRLFLAPNGVTTRVEYTVTGEAGKTGSRNAEIRPDYHAALQRAGATTVPVTFVPAEPDISRLKTGEVVEQDFLKTPLGGYGLAGVGSLMCLGFLIVAVMQWNGWDVDLDSKTGKILIKRFGEGK